MKIDIRALDRSRSVKNHSERTFGRDLWVQMFERSGRCVPWICKKRQSSRFAFLVQFLEPFFVEIGLAAYFKNLWRRTAQLMRHGRGRLDVLCDVVSNQTVASRRSVFELPIF